MIVIVCGEVSGDGVWRFESPPLTYDLGVVGVGGERRSSLLGVRFGAAGLTC